MSNNSKKIGFKFEHKKHFGTALAALLICIIAIYLLPISVRDTSPPRQMSESELREGLAALADEYTLAKNVVEKQSVARRMHSLRVQYENPTKPFTGFDGVTLLRVLIIITILLLGIKLLQLTVLEYKLAKAD